MEDKDQHWKVVCFGKMNIIGTIELLSMKNQWEKNWSNRWLRDLVHPWCWKLRMSLINTDERHHSRYIDFYKSPFLTVVDMAPSTLPDPSTCSLKNYIPLALSEWFPSNFIGFGNQKNLLVWQQKQGNNRRTRLLNPN